MEIFFSRSTLGSGLAAEASVEKREESKKIRSLAVRSHTCKRPENQVEPSHVEFLKASL